MAGKKALSITVEANTSDAEEAINKLTDSTKDVEKAAIAGSDAIDNLADDAAKSFKNPAEAAKQAAAELNDAFRRMGVTSDADAARRRKAVIDEFDKIKKAGTASWGEITRAQERMNVKLRRIDESVGKHAIQWKKLGKEGWDAATKIWGGIGFILKSLRNITLGAVGFGTAFTAALYKVAKGTADFDNENRKLAAQANIPIDVMSAMRVQAEKYGIQIDELSAGLRKFMTQAGKVALKDDGSYATLNRLIADNANAFDKLNIALVDSNGNKRDYVEILQELGKALADVKDKSERARLAKLAFDEKSGPVVSRLLDNKQFDVSSLASSTIFADFKKNVDKAVSGQEKIAAAKDKISESMSNPFRQLGIDVLDATGKVKSFFDLYSDAVEKLRAMPEGIKKNTLVGQLFGEESGVNFIPLINSGTSGYDEARKEAEKTGLITTKEDAENAKKFEESLTSLKNAFSGFRNEIGRPVLDHWIVVFRDLKDTIIQNKEPIINALVAISDKFLGMLVDFVHMLRGDDDTTIANKWMLKLRDDIQSVLPSIDKITESLIELADAMGKVAAVGRVAQGIGHAVMTPFVLAGTTAVGTWQNIGKPDSQRMSWGDDDLMAAFGEKYGFESYKKYDPRPLWNSTSIPAPSFSMPVPAAPREYSWQQKVGNEIYNAKLTLNVGSESIVTATSADGLKKFVRALSDAERRSYMATIQDWEGR